MRIQPAESAVALELPTKTESDKKTSTDLFALLLAALSGIPIPTEVKAVPNLEQQTNGAANAQIEALLKALPQGTTVEQLLLNLPKESSAMSALLIELRKDLDIDPKVATISDTSIDAPEMAGESANLIKPEAKALPEVKPLDNDITEASPEGQTKTADTVLPLTQVPSQASLAQSSQQNGSSLSQQPRPETNPRPQHVEASVPVASGEVPQASLPAVTTSLPVVSAETLQQLRTEIISFSNNPIRPTITLEVSPPEYGRVVVSAERDPQGLVTVRLVVETPAAKQAMAQQLPQVFAGAASTSTTVTVLTTEEYQEFREEQRERNSDRNKEQRERRRREQPHEVEFVI